MSGRSSPVAFGRCVKTWVSSLSRSLAAQPPPRANCVRRMAALASFDMREGYHRRVESKSWPCGSGVPERACCARYHAGEPAPTAEALMRSRYTAYVRGEIDYLLRTHHASTRDTVDVRAVKKWSKTTLWLGLEIVASSETGDTAVVEFIARGSTAGKAFAQRERSRFSRVDGAWFYLDGDG